jgi:hypothetical protein
MLRELRLAVEYRKLSLRINSFVKIYRQKEAHEKIDIDSIIGIGRFDGRDRPGRCGPDDLNIDFDNYEDGRRAKAEIGR